MSDKIVAVFQILQDSLGLHPATIAALALLFALVFALLALYTLARLRASRKILAQFAEQLGYEPPYGDGSEILDQEAEKKIGNVNQQVQFAHLEQRIAELETEAETRDKNLATAHQHAKDLEAQLRQAFLENDRVAGQASEQAHAHQVAFQQLEQRTRQIEAESTANLAANEQHVKDLENQLQQAYFQVDKITTVANDQAQAHRKAVDEFQQRGRDEESHTDANLTALQRRSKELEDELQKAILRNESLTAQAAEQEQAQRNTIDQLEQHIRQMESEAGANLAALQGRSSELEEQLQQALLRNDHVAAQAAEQAQAHRATVDQLAQRVRQMEAESNASLDAFEQRAKDLERQLQQASLHNDNLTAQAQEHAQAYRSAVEQHEQRIHQLEDEHTANLASLRQRAGELEQQLERAAVLNGRITEQANEQAQTHRSAIEQLEQRIHQMHAEHSANLAALQQRSGELEEQLQQSTQLTDHLKSQSGEQAQAHRNAIEQLEQRIHQMHAEHSASLAALQQRSGELEEQLQRSTQLTDHLTAQAGQQALTHSSAIEQLEQRIHQMHAEHSASLAALQQRSRELEEQLQQATQHTDHLTAQAGQQALTHSSAIEQLELRIHQMEAEQSANLAALEQGSRDMEQQLQHAAIQNLRLTAQAEEQAQAHRDTVEQHAQRIHQLEAEHSANLAALNQQTIELGQHSRELEQQLQQVTLRAENEKALARQAALEQATPAEPLTQRLHDLEAEKEAADAQLKTLQARITELQDQLQQAAVRIATVEAPKSQVPAVPSAQLLRHAEWIMGRAIGPVLPYGVVAAEAYAAAALAANPQGADAPQLLAELARIRRALPQGLPSVSEAITTFDEKAAAFFNADPARAAEFADEEAQRRYRAGLNRSARMAANTALELRQKDRS